MLIHLSSIATDIVSGYAQASMATIGENLKRIRGEEDQKVVAARMQIPQTRLSNWEKDRFRNLSLKTLLWLAKGYDCLVEDLLVGVDPSYDEIVNARGGSSYEKKDAGTNGKSVQNSTALSQVSHIEQVASGTGGQHHVDSSPRDHLSQPASSSDRALQEFVEIESTFDAIDRLDTIAESVRLVASDLRNRLGADLPRKKKPKSIGRRPRLRTTKTKRERRA